MASLPSSPAGEAHRSGSPAAAPAAGRTRPWRGRAGRSRSRRAAESVATPATDRAPGLGGVEADHRQGAEAASRRPGIATSVAGQQPVGVAGRPRRRRDRGQPVVDACCRGRLSRLRSSADSSLAPRGRGGRSRGRAGRRSAPGAPCRRAGARSPAPVVASVATSSVGGPTSTTTGSPRVGRRRPDDSGSVDSGRRPLRRGPADGVGADHDRPGRRRAGARGRRCRAARATPAARGSRPVTSYVVRSSLLDPDQQRAVGLDQVGLVDAGLLDVGAGRAGGGPHGPGRDVVGGAGRGGGRLGPVEVRGQRRRQVALVPRRPLGRPSPRRSTRATPRSTYQPSRSSQEAAGGQVGVDEARSARARREASAATGARDRVAARAPGAAERERGRPAP